MEENQSRRQAPATSSRLGMRAASAAAVGGEIVEVQGGHIVRSTGRKDRHSKVCTAKGPRDRRVRLSAHTAIQFYDVQDRLGYDRPSKAVDWLIKKAKAAIDELAELPAWKPTTASATASTSNPSAAPVNDGAENHLQLHRTVDAVASGSNSRRTAMVGSDGGVVQNQNFQLGDTQGNHGSSFLPPSLDSDAIADTIKSFFPMGASAETSSEIQFQSYPPDLLSRTSSHSQDLRLSLQSLHDPMLQPHQGEQNLFFGANPLGYDFSDMGRFPRMVGWNSGADSGNAGNGDGGNGGFVFNSPAPPQLQPFFSGQNQFFPQRGPLQSSNTPSVRAWIDSAITTTTSTTTTSHYQVPPFMHHQSSMSSIGFALGGFPGFNIPARIQGEEEHDGMQNKPSSASSDSRH